MVIDLNIAEKFLFLAQHKEKGRFAISDVHINYGLVGSLLLEMTTEGIIDIEDKKLILKERGRVENEIISDMIEIISNSVKLRKVNYWMNKFARKSKKYKNIVLEKLERNRLIRIEKKKFLGFIPYSRNYLTDKNAHDSLVREIKRNIFYPQDLTSNQVSLLALIEACKMHKILSTDKEELKTIKSNLKLIIKESPIAKTVDETIKQIQAAIMVTVITSSTVVTS